MSVDLLQSGAMHDPLLALFPSPHDADRPWLNCYGADERVELTGHVLSMWLAKIAGLITAESTRGDGVHVGLPPHWRTVAWACGAWSAGRTVLLGSTEEIDNAGLSPELSVAFTPEDLCDTAEVQVLVPAASLALRWPGTLPALVLDGAADLMSFPDRFTPVSAPADLPCLTDLCTDLTASGTRGGVLNGAEPTTLTRRELAARVEATATATEGQAGSRAALVRCTRTTQALQKVLSAWSAGRTAVVLTPEAGDDVAAAAIRQEGITDSTAEARTD